MNPEMHEEYYKLGFVYEINNQKREAFDSYLLANELNPNNEKVCIKLAQLYWE